MSSDMTTNLRSSPKHKGCNLNDGGGTGGGALRRVAQAEAGIDFGRGGEALEEGAAHLKVGDADLAFEDAGAIARGGRVDDADTLCSC